MLVEVVELPEVPVIVTVALPIAAVSEAVKVTTLVLVVGFVPNDAVTPGGRPVAASVTFPVKPPAFVTVIVLVFVLPWPTITAAGLLASVKLEAAFTVTATVVVWIAAPSVPVIVTFNGPPTVAVPLAVSVRVLEPVVVGFGLKLAVTPFGRLLALNLMAEEKPCGALMLMTSVLFAP